MLTQLVLEFHASLQVRENRILLSYQERSLKGKQPWLPQGNSTTLGKGHLGSCSCPLSPATGLFETLCRAPGSHRCGPWNPTLAEKWPAPLDHGLDPVWSSPRNSGCLWVSVGPPSAAPFLLQRRPLWDMDVWPRPQWCWWETKISVCVYIL